MRIPFLTRLMEIKEKQLSLEIERNNYIYTITFNTQEILKKINGSKK